LCDFTFFAFLPAAVLAFSFPVMSDLVFRRLVPSGLLS
jgi:hypothetical protein